MVSQQLILIAQLLILAAQHQRLVARGGECATHLLQTSGGLISEGSPVSELLLGATLQCVREGMGACGVLGLLRSFRVQARRLLGQRTQRRVPGLERLLELVEPLQLRAARGHLARQQTSRPERVVARS